MTRHRAVRLAFLVAAAAVATRVPAAAQAPADVLPSWNDGAARAAIVSFVDRVTRTGGPDFVPPAERIATFDNDGTLWSEQPMYFQLLFAFDRIRAMAPSHPKWKDKQPYKAVIEGDMKALAASGQKGVLEIMAVTHTGMTTDQFEKEVRDWVASARHPKTKKPYNEMIYQPMVELMAYLRANGFKTYIVSGGGIDFMRPWVERAYSIPPEQVVGSRAKVTYEVGDGPPRLVKHAAVDHIDDGPGKPVGIYQVIGRRPIAAFGNSDGDFQMLEYVTSGPGPRLGVIVHHTDGVREWAYDRGSHIGKLERGLDEAGKRGWTLVDMKSDWKVIYPFEMK